MYIKNLQTILTFVTCVSLVLSSPIKDDLNKTISIIKDVKPTEAMQPLSDILKITEFRGDDKVDELLETGGFDNDTELLEYVLNEMGFLNMTSLYINNIGMACSAFQTPNEKGNGYYFGRNFDWLDCNTLILVNHPDDGYSSISTVNPDFLNWLAEGGSYEEVVTKALTDPESIKKLPDDVLRLSSLYTPLDGLNEKGLSISVNMLYEDPANQTVSGRIDLTSLPLIRVLLDKAANVDEAIDIIENVNMHSSFDLDLHYLIADTTGRSVAVEYIGNELSIVEANAITNFYVSEERLNVGYGQDRYEIIQQRMKEYPNMSEEDVKDTLNAVHQGTQWSVIYDQLNLEATFYIRSDYEQGYHIKLFDDESDNESDDDTLVNVDTELDEGSDSDSDETEVETM